MKFPIILRSLFGFCVVLFVMSLGAAFYAFARYVEVPDSANGELLLLTVWQGVLFGFLTCALMLVQWATKIPERVSWLDIALGFGGLGWALFLSATVLWESIYHMPAPWIWQVILIIIDVYGVIIPAFKFHTHPHTQPLFPFWK